MGRASLYEELRLIERSESEVSGSWKGAHLLLFFLAFVFGSFCTFCFHMLMYLFDEKCVLFPKLLSLTSLRHNVIYEFIPEEKERADSALPVDFLSTQWVEKSACYLPTYVPLVSGIFGLVWTTMFLMCSSGGRSLSGLQRSWRVIPPVLIFSVAMSGLCIYSSSVTHYGLRELCVKLGEITGSSTCSYTVNVATLAYERQIRGVYQATRLTITSAWMHTGCWLASAFLALARIVLAVDFRLVKIRVELVGDIEKMLERHEQQLRTVMPIQEHNDDKQTSLTSVASTQLIFKNEQYDSGKQLDDGNDLLYMSEQPILQSELSLLPEERNRLARVKAFKSVRKEYHFIVNIVYDLLDSLNYSPVFSNRTISSSTLGSSLMGLNDSESDKHISRQLGQQTISSKEQYSNSSGSSKADIKVEDTERVSKDIRKQLQKRLTKLDEKKLTPSVVNLIHKIKAVGKTESHKLQRSIHKKSNLKSEYQNIGIQTEDKLKMKYHKKQKVTIAESNTTFYEENEDEPSSSSKKDFDKTDSVEKDSLKKDSENPDLKNKSEKKNKKNGSPKQDPEKRVFEEIDFIVIKDSEDRDSEKQEFEKKVSGKHDFEEKDSENKHSEKQEFKKKESEEQDFEKKDSEKQDSYKQTFEKKDSEQQEFEKQDSDQQKRKNKDSEKKDSKKKE